MQWPWIKLYVSELLGDRRFRKVLRHQGHHVLTVWSILIDCANKVEGEWFSLDIMDDLVDYGVVTLEQAVNTLVTFSTDPFDWIEVEGLPDEECEPDGPVRILLTGWKRRYGGALRTRKYRERKDQEGDDTSEDRARHPLERTGANLGGSGPQDPVPVDEEGDQDLQDQIFLQKAILQIVREGGPKGVTRGVIKKRTKTEDEELNPNLVMLTRTKLLEVRRKRYYEVVNG